uniref:Reverse transcriptase Ty1/copia-type domain-containing protein n=1 Tax=Fagus sylvatica TaxID=28930 RepID=A0A2N9IIJ0_FAGSY
MELQRESIDILVQCTLALLSQSGLTLSYWSYALATATHLINKLPTPLLHMSSPWEQLHNVKPNFSYLKTFGCKCFPLLSPYNTHKLQPKTIPCIFLGYPPTTKGYLCQDPISKRLYISRHVLFNETEFPALKPDMHTTSQPSVPNSYSPDSWFTHLLSTHTSLSCTSCPNSTGPIPFDQNLPSQSLIDTSTTSIHPSNIQLVISDHLAAHTPPVANPHTQPAHTNIPAPDSADTSTLAPDSADTSIPAPPIPPLLPTLSNTHPMQTRSKHGIFKPKPCYTAHLDYAFTEPPNFKIASQLSQWCQAMKDEYDALIKQATWSLVPPPPNHNVVGCKWVYKLKTHSDGSIARYKARLVAKGFHQQQVSLNWPLRQLDVSNAFLHGILKEEVYMSQPQGYIDPQHPHYVCKLHKSIYGLKQAPRAWFERFTGQLLQFGFAASTADSSLFIYRTKTTIAYLLLYVDDIVLTSNTPTFLDHLIHHLSSVFDLKDLGPLNYFLGIQVTRDSTGLHLSQAKYATALLHKHQMLHTKPISTPCIPNTRLSLHDGTKLHDPHAYRSLVGALHYLTFTRPDLSFAVHQVCQYMASPTSVHLMAAKRILRYLKGDPDDKRSTSGLLVYLGPNPITWSAKKQLTVSRSSTESEYRALALASAELCWFRTLLKDLGVFISAAPILWCDNISALAIASNPVFHARTKHIEVDFHFVRERVLRKDLAVKFVSTLDQLADIFTKSLPPHRFLALRSHLMATVRPPELEEGC